MVHHPSYRTIIFCPSTITIVTNITNLVNLDKGVHIFCRTINNIIDYKNPLARWIGSSSVSVSVSGSNFGYGSNSDSGSGSVSIKLEYGALDNPKIILLELLVTLIEL